MEELKQKDEINLKSNEVNEIMTKMPNWTIRWGISVVFIAVILLLLASWFIKYPDTISANVVLTTRQPPIHVTSRESGNIKLYVSEASQVERGQLLGHIESTADIRDVQFTKGLLFSLKWGFPKESVQSLLSVINMNLQLGELQQDLNSLQGFLNEYLVFTNARLFHEKITFLQDRIERYIELNKQLNFEKSTTLQEYEIYKKSYMRDSILFAEGVISTQSFENSMVPVLQSEKALKNYNTVKINNDLQILSLKQEIADLKARRVESEQILINNVMSAAKSLQTNISKWELQYLFYCPIDGSVSLNKFWSNDQYIMPNDLVMTIIPSTKSVFGQLAVPIAGSGKIKTGQLVKIELANYPSHEFGTINGVIHSIGAIPTDGMYLVEIELIEGLLSSYNIKLEYDPEMIGNAKIITEDLSLIERVFNQLIEIIKN